MERNEECAKVIMSLYMTISVYDYTDITSAHVRPTTMLNETKLRYAGPAY